MKPPYAFIAGVLFGALLVLIWCNRYSFFAVGAGNGTGYVIRWNRWTGEATSELLAPYGSSHTHFDQ